METTTVITFLAIALALLALVAIARADSTIDATERYAYAANAGWINANWNPAAPGGGEGAVVTDYILSGHIWSANFGWIFLGDGSPVNGVQYLNLDPGSGPDIGVNHDGAGRLSGLAWGANIGWIVFDQNDWNETPLIDLVSGQMSGRVWSANAGWIVLDATFTVRVTTLSLPVTDSDGDGIGDAWEREQVAAAGLSTGNPTTDLTIMGSMTYSDGDPFSDVQEYIMDSDPFDATKYLRVVNNYFNFSMVDLEWTSSPRRLYDIIVSEDLKIWTYDSVDFPGDPIGDTTFGTAFIPFGPMGSPEKFYQRIIAKLPLTP